MKRGIHDLALAGGPPAFLRDLRVGRPNTGSHERFLEHASRALDEGGLTHGGPLVREFEERIARAAGVRHCIAVCNATVGLELLARDLAADGGVGDEVIMPSLTFVATGCAVAGQGLKPVFCDVEADTGLIDPDRIEALITPRTRAVIGVHLFGQACDVTRMAKLAEAHGLRLFFDAAHAFGGTYRDRQLGSFGDAEVFSFHATKVINCFEGGAIVTNDDALADRMRSLRYYGFGDGGEATVVGTNAKMHEISAAMGLTSLDAFDEIVADNRADFEQYRRLLADVPGVSTLGYDERNRNNHHYLVVTVDAEAAGLHRDVLLDVLRAENIIAQPYFARGVHQMTPYRSTPPPWLPNTERLCGQLLALPTGPSVGTADVAAICDVIRTAVAHGPELTLTARRGAKADGPGSE